MKTILGLAAAGGLAVSAHAGIVVETYGRPASAPATAGSWALTPGAFDPQAAGPVSTAPLSSASTLNFVPSVTHQVSAPSSWGRSYSGGTYSTDDATTLAITVAGNQVRALSLFVTPNPYAVFALTGTGSDGAASASVTDQTSGLPHNGGTAWGWGFYGTGASFVQTLLISCDVPFTVGEFSYNNPSPSAAALLGLAAAARARRRR